MTINIKQTTKEKLSAILGIIIFFAVCVLVVALNEIIDVECVKSQNICTVYSHKAFQPREVTEMFKISEVMYGEVVKERTTGKNRHTYYNVVLKFKSGQSLNLYNITTKIYISSFNFYAKKYRMERTKRCKNNIMN